MAARKHRLYICLERYCCFGANIWSFHHAIVEDMSWIAWESAWTSCINHKILPRDKGHMEHSRRFASLLSINRRRGCRCLGLNYSEWAVMLQFHGVGMLWQPLVGSPAHDYGATSRLQRPNYCQLPLYMYSWMRSMYIFHHVTDIICGRRWYMGTHPMVLGNFCWFDGWRNFCDTG